MNTQTLFNAKYHRSSAQTKPRSQRTKYKVLEMLIERGTSTPEELAVLLRMTAQAINRITQSLALSGLITWAEAEGQRLTITDTGIRVWRGANREKQLKPQHGPDSEWIGPIGTSAGTSAG